MPSLGSGAFFRRGFSSSAQSAGVLVNFAGFHGGAPVAPPIGIAMDPSNDFERKPCALQIGGD